MGNDNSLGSLEMEYSLITSDCKAKRQQLVDEMDGLIECAVNYDELLECFEEKEKIDPCELVWNNAKDHRHFDDIENTIRLLDCIVALVDEVINAGDDKKKAHQIKKAIETLITSARRIKKESKEFIAREQQVIGEADSTLAWLDKIRDKYS